MKMITGPAVAGLFVLYASASSAACIPAQGLVTLTPDPACRIFGAMSTWSAPEAPDAFLGAPPGPGAPPPVCFSAVGTGTVQFSGFSGLTTVPVAGVDGNVTVAPLVYPIPSVGLRSSARAFTSQSVLNSKIAVGRDRKSGTLFTKDTGNITNDGKAAEIIMIAGGTGGFAGASGTIEVAGQELGGFAVYTGTICTPG
jgi:hypothetical protein